MVIFGSRRVKRYQVGNSENYDISPTECSSVAGGLRDLFPKLFVVLDRRFNKLKI
jgi:hypothetical protein